MLHTAKMATNMNKQLINAKRFGDIAIDTQFVGTYLLYKRAIRAQENNRDVHTLRVIT